MSLYMDITKNFGDFRLSSSLELGNDTLGILGASGCGKSLTLKCIAGIITPDSGTIVLNDKILFDSKKKVNLPPQKRKVGYLFQNYALFPHMSVAQNIGIGVQKPSTLKKQVIASTIKTFALSGLENHYPDQLSGGQQQRVALARIFASEPDILMLDEPFSALDTSLRWQLELEMAQLLKHFAGPTLFVSHNRDEVYHLCNHIALMDAGQIMEIGTQDDLLTHPTTLSAALLLGCKNISPAIKLSDHTLKALNWDLTLYSSEPIPDQLKYVGIESHALKLTKDQDAPNTLLGKVVQVIGSTNSVRMGLQPTNKMTCSNLLYIEMEKENWNNLKTKALLSVSIPPHQLLLLT